MANLFRKRLQDTVAVVYRLDTTVFLDMQLTTYRQLNHSFSRLVRLTNWLFFYQLVSVANHFEGNDKRIYDFQM